MTKRRKIYNHIATGMLSSIPTEGCPQILSLLQRSPEPNSGGAIVSSSGSAACLTNMTPTITLDLLQTILENTALLLGVAVNVAALRDRNDDQRR